MNDHAFDADLATRADAGEKSLAALQASLLRNVYARQAQRAQSPAEAAVIRLHRLIQQPHVQRMYDFLTKHREVHYD